MQAGAQQVVSASEGCDSRLQGMMEIQLELAVVGSGRGG